jgi:hypothetical protein
LKPPLFLVDLMTLPDNSGFCYSTSVDAIHSRTVAMFDRAIAELQVGKKKRAGLKHTYATFEGASCFNHEVLAYTS